MASSAIRATLQLLVHLAVFLSVVNVQAQRPYPGPGPPSYGFDPTSWPFTDSYPTVETVWVTIPAPPTPPVPSLPDVPVPSIPSLGITQVTVTTATFVEPPPLAPTRTLTIQAATGTSNLIYPASPSSNPLSSDIRLSSTAKQCEPFHIHYNLTSPRTILFDTPDRQRFLSIRLPTGVGCMEWVCNVQAGYSFYVSGPLSEYYVVQPGSSSACLHSITTTYAYAEYNTIAFQSFTAHPPNTTPPPADFQASPIIPFPASSCSAITVNAIPIFVPTTFTNSGPTSLPSPGPHSAASHRPKVSAIAGGVIGGIGLTLLVLLAVLFILRKRRKSCPQDAMPCPAFLRQTNDILSPSVLDVRGQPASSSNLPSYGSETHLGTIFTRKPREPVPPHGRTPSPASTIAAPLPQKGGPAFSLFSATSLPQLQPVNRELLLQSPLDATTDIPTVGLSPRTEDSPTTATLARQTGIHNDQSNLQMIVESFAQLDRMDRQAVLSILGDTMTPNALTRLSELPPPPYGGYGSAPHEATESLDAVRTTTE